MICAVADVFEGDVLCFEAEVFADFLAVLPALRLDRFADGCVDRLAFFFVVGVVKLDGVVVIMLAHVIELGNFIYGIEIKWSAGKLFEVVGAKGIG